MTYKRTPMRLAADFSMEMLQAKREWQKISQVMRIRGLRTRLLYPAMLSIKDRKTNKEFPRQNKPQQIQENWNHIKHFLWAQGTETRNKSQGNIPKTLKARREWKKIFQVMRTRGLQPRILYPARLSIKMEGQIQSFPDKRSPKEYTSTKPAAQEMLKGLL